MFYIHLGTTNKYVGKLTEQEIEEYLNSGWQTGKCPTHWITNGTENRLLKEGLPLPEGFIFGQSEEFKRKNSEGGKRRWKNMSDEERDNLSKNISDSIKNMWENMSDEELALREKHRMDTRANWTDEKIEQYHIKMSTSAKLDRAKRTPEQNKRSADKGFNTRRLRGNMRTSKHEEDMYTKLVEIFSESEVERNYNKDPRYPFHCDFYIKPLDLFIELNLHPSHGNRPYDSNDEECQQQLQLWEDKANESEYYGNFIKTWTIRDVNKQTIAKNNNLNYITLYSVEEMSNFIKGLYK